MLSISFEPVSDSKEGLTAALYWIPMESNSLTNSKQVAFIQSINNKLYGRKKALKPIEWRWKINADL